MVLSIGPEKGKIGVTINPTVAKEKGRFTARIQYLFQEKQQISKPKNNIDWDQFQPGHTVEGNIKKVTNEISQGFFAGLFEPSVHRPRNRFPIRLVGTDLSSHCPL